MNEESKPDGPDPSAEPEPTLRVDEDWKEQVAKEKAAEAGDAATDDGDTVADASAADDSAAADDGAAASPIPSDETSDVAADADASHDATSPAGTPADRSSSAGASRQMPPASFEFLISMLFTQAMSFLGQIPNPESGESLVDKPMAKHSIDTLDLLTEKTRGNLTEDESRMLSDSLHALRMTYVNARNPSE